ncbi:hypothetical protein [Saccharothrix xinjiangensis]|uniref:Uncharacterized protein n=1 Tax=Saccharothrix xinjiangensis TaxID=204798 RepID=A0ABV9Y8U5_9PSEU
MTADRLLLDALAHLVDHLDPAPGDLPARAAGALAERVEATPLRLLTDSALVTPPGTRGRCATRTLRFVGLDLQLDHSTDGLHATGLTTPAHTAPARPGHLAAAAPPCPAVEAIGPPPPDHPASPPSPPITSPRTSGLLVTNALAVVRWPGGEVRAAIDRAGWFHLDGVPSGPVKFLLLGPAARHATPWFVA